MADYYAVLKKAIGGLPEPSGEARRGLYEKARNALLAQLKAMDPPLTATEITQQRLQLEEAIRKVEGEATRGSLAQVVARPATPAAPPAAPPPANAAPADAPARPAPAVSVPAREPVRHTAIMPARPAPVAPASAAARATPPLAKAEPPPADPAGPVDLDAAAEATRTSRKPAAPPPPDQAPAGPDGMPAGGDMAGTPATSTERRRAARAAARAASAAPTKAAYRLPKRPPARIVIAASVLVAILAVGVAAYTQWPAIQAMILTAGEPSQPPAPPAPTPVAGTAGLPPKSDDRLGEPPRVTAEPPVSRPVPTVSIKPTIEQQAPADVAQQPEPPAAAPAATPGQPPMLPPVPGAQPSPAPQTALADPDSLQPQAPTPAQPGELPLVAHQAFLYEEGSPGTNQGTRIAGQVVWQAVQETDATGVKGDIMIRARAEIPERKMVAIITIKPNRNAALEATHLVEIRFELPADSAARGVANVPGLILKPTEQARGEPLRGASAKIAPGFFWIALGKADADRTYNVALIKDRAWIDLPILYENNRRAILTIEKGATGERVVTDALTAWSS